MQTSIAKKPTNSSSNCWIPWRSSNIPWITCSSGDSNYLHPSYRHCSKIKLYPCKQRDHGRCTTHDCTRVRAVIYVHSRLQNTQPVCLPLGKRVLHPVPTTLQKCLLR